MLIGLLECLNVSMWILVNVDVEGLSLVLSLWDAEIDSVQRKHTENPCYNLRCGQISRFQFAENFF